MTDVLEESVAQLAALGVQVELDTPGLPGAQSMTIRLERGSSKQRYALVLRERATRVDLATAENKLPTIVVDHFISPRSADSLRRVGAQYVDAAGNAWIEFGDVLIDIRGRRPLQDIGSRPHRAGGNLFSSARAKVAFALLAWPSLWEARQRDLAHAAGVSLGQANNALALFRESGFGPPPSGRSAELLNLWAAAFPSGLARRITLATYQGTVGPVEGVNADDEVFISGEAAAGELLRPATLTIYVEQLDPRLPIVNRWNSDGPANIVVRSKFWQTPGVAAPHGEGPLSKTSNVPWPLVVADLLASDDPRVRGTAAEWRERFAEPA